MGKRYIWPSCTVQDCTCKRSWPTEKGAMSAATRHLGNWINPDGSAVCYCHGTDQATFPCDRSQVRQASV